MILRSFILTFLILILTPIFQAQSTSEKQTLDTIYELTEKAIFANEFAKSAALAANYRGLATKTRDPLLIAKSYYLLAKSLPKQGIYKGKAEDYYQKAVLQFTDIEQNEQTKLILWQILVEVANLDSSPDYVHSESELQTATQTLFKIYKFSKNHDGEGYRELERRSAAYLSNYFAVRGNILTQIIWLEKAVQPLEASPESQVKITTLFEIYLRLQRAYRRVGEYDKAFQMLEKLQEFLIKYPNDVRRLDYLRHLADSAVDLKNDPLIYQTLEEGIKLANKSHYRIGEFYTTLIIKLLEDKKIAEATERFQTLQNLISQGEVVENLDISTIKAVIAGYQGKTELSDREFAEGEQILEKELGQEWINSIFYLNWKSAIALFQNRFDELREVSLKYSEIALKNHNKDSMPLVFLNLAKAELGLGNLEEAVKYNQQAIDLIESKRLSHNPQISIGIMEVLYEAYQLEVTLKQHSNLLTGSLLASEKLKSRWLADKILNRPLEGHLVIDDNLRSHILDTSTKLLERPDDGELNEELSKLESSSLFAVRQPSQTVESFDQKIDLEAELDKLPLDEQTVIISYIFTADQKLTAFVARKGKKLTSVSLDLSLSGAENLTLNLQSQIENGVFYKDNGQKIYQILLKPLNLSDVKHLIIIPDQSLWKIPFQALSADGKKFLIEETEISYAPSISVLLNQIAMARPARKSFQVFSNAHFNNYFLKFADEEAKFLAAAYAVKPSLSASVSQFLANSANSDIIHFSMHAEVNRNAPFNSFLAFNKDSQFPSGKLTVNDLLKVKLKNQALVFLASCSTNNVFNSEGLVSLSWGMMAAGATTVVSAQWEANDESTEQFTQRFYKFYREGMSASKAFQNASIEMIRLPDSKLNKPFYWAEFTLNGDYR